MKHEIGEIEKAAETVRCFYTSCHNRAVDKPLAKKICIYENICTDESLR